MTFRLLPRIAAAALAVGAWVSFARAESAPLVLGNRRELFVDDFLIAQSQNAVFLLHNPVRRELVLKFDAPWEGSGSDFERIIRVGDRIRMYYMATKLTVANGTRLSHQPTYACLAESQDGIHWTRPNLGLFEFQGSKQSNIVWSAPKLDNFTPFLDTNPKCLAGERYKATSRGEKALYGFKSADGIHWSRISEQPIITFGWFDTQNNAFWDPVRQQYWCYVRGFHDRNGADTTDTADGIRDIRVSTSADFHTWTQPKFLRFIDSPDEALYTNQVEPYYRAPQIFVGFPTRYVERNFTPAAMAALPDPGHRQRRMKFSRRFGLAVTDGQFMTSRDGYAFHRWNETFLPPGPQRDNNWIYGDGYKCLGLLETPSEDFGGENELSFYADEGEWKEGRDGDSLRRYTIRIDGFVSLHANQARGEVVTKPIVFSGRTLSLNFATTAAGSIWVQLEDAAGRPLPGFTRNEADEIFGDKLDRTVTWQNRSDVSSLAGQPIRIRLALREADLYSLKFQD